MTRKRAVHHGMYIWRRTDTSTRLQLDQSCARAAAAPLILCEVEGKEYMLFTDLELARR